jgi:hypothetical protein
VNTCHHISMISYFQLFHIRRITKNKHLPSFVRINKVSKQGIYYERSTNESWEQKARIPVGILALFKLEKIIRR